MEDDQVGAIVGQMAGALYGWQQILADEWSNRCVACLHYNLDSFSRIFCYLANGIKLLNQGKEFDVLGQRCRNWLAGSRLETWKPSLPCYTIATP